MRLGRSHPVLTAAVAGAAVGFVIALATELGLPFTNSSHAVLHMLWPNAATGESISGARVMQAGLALLLDFTGSMLGYALLFAILVALFVGVRRVFGKRRV